MCQIFPKNFKLKIRPFFKMFRFDLLKLHFTSLRYNAKYEYIKA